MIRRMSTPTSTWRCPRLRAEVVEHVVKAAGDGGFLLQWDGRASMTGVLRCEDV